MADVRKRNTKAIPATPAVNAKAVAPAPAGNNNILYIVIAGVAALAVYYLQFQNSPSTTTTTTTTSKETTTSSIASSAPATSSVASESGKLQLTDEQLADYTGADPDKPIYVALNGTIFDVSSGRSFYGPGGHYGHFAGRDATRAWVSTCFEPEYLTWDMKGVDIMFTPKWMDEEMEDAANGKLTGDMPAGISVQAAELVQKVGKVSKAEKRKRREEDAVEIKEGIEQAMGHWMNFFKNNPKYKEIGEVVGRKPLDEDRADIGLCEEALKKRPIKGGKFGKALEQGQAIANEGQKAPDFVKGKTS